MPRALWTGSITFGLVNIPVRLYSAVAEHTLHFHLVHKKDDGRIGYEKICKEEGKPVPDDEIAKAFEYSQGKFVYMTDEDFEQARIDGYKSIDIRDFVPYEDIDPILFRHTYLVGPQEGAERVYALLVEAMEQSALAGIAKFIMRDRQNLGCIRVRNGVLTLEQMYFQDELRPLDELQPKQTRVDQRELELALQVIDSFAGRFEPGKYKDTYRDTLLRLIKAKRKGKQIHAAPEQEEETPSDLMEALRQSIQQTHSKQPKRRTHGRSSRTSSVDDLGRLTKGELLALAKKAELPGRSQMDKAKLVKALRSG